MPHGVEPSDCPAFHDVCHCDSYPCPDCIEGYPKDRIERAAKAMHDAFWGPTYKTGDYDPIGRQKTGDLAEIMMLYGAMALAAIRAFYTEGTDHD